jgi:hypothetical protein
MENSSQKGNGTSHLSLFVERLQFETQFEVISSAETRATNHEEGAVNLRSNLPFLRQGHQTLEP